VSSHPAPDRDAHHRFCRIEGWIEVTSATGTPVRHHQTFELVLDDGSILRTRISRPVERTTYSGSMWSHILRDQLAVTADEFWACAQQNIVPARSAVSQSDPRALPLYVMNELVTRLGLQPEAAAALTPAEAAEAIAAYWRGQS
jgi:hypothetical protein